MRKSHHRTPLPSIAALATMAGFGDHLLVDREPRGNTAANASIQALARNGKVGSGKRRRRRRRGRRKHNKGVS
ncbi:MAG: hypothetical protein ACOC93_02155 [Planctomycetota bacterium]